MSDERIACVTLGEDLALLALGVLTGRERADALAHLERCEDCRDALAGLARTADRLVTIAPALEPPPGFATRVLAAIDPPADRRVERIGRRRHAALVAAGVLLAGALGITASRTGSRPAPAPSVRSAALRGPAGARGGIAAYAGPPARLVVVVEHLGPQHWVSCVVETRAGTRLAIGTFWLDHGSGSWSAPLRVPLDTLQSAEIVAPDGAVVASGRLSG